MMLGLPPSSGLISSMTPVSGTFRLPTHLPDSMLPRVLPALTFLPAGLVLMLTSFSQRVGETTLSVSRGFSLEAEDYIDKPVKPAELLARVEKQLRKKGK